MLRAFSAKCTATTLFFERIRSGGNHQPTGGLTVTYEHKASAKAEKDEEDETKNCPQCAEKVNAAALVCRFCGYKFDKESVTTPPAIERAARST
jgi:ribosomal protein L37AE/L43A